VLEPVQADQLDEFRRPRWRFQPRTVLNLQPYAISRRRFATARARRLEHHRHRMFAGPEHRRAADANLPALSPASTRRRREKGRFPAPARADDRDELPSSTRNSRFEERERPSRPGDVVFDVDVSRFELRLRWVTAALASIVLGRHERTRHRCAETYHDGEGCSVGRRQHRWTACIDRRSAAARRVTSRE